MIRMIAGFVLLISLASCGGSHDDVVVNASDDEPLMVAAFKQAKNEIHTLDENIAKDGVYCGIKVGFKYPGGTEYCWISHVAKVAGSTDEYQGAFDNDPDHAIGQKAGDTVTVKRERIIDWIVKGDGPALGNYTLKALFPKMSPKDIDEAKQAMGWK